MKKLLLHFATAALALVIVLPAHADVIKQQSFMVGDLNGPLAGQTFSGSFSWDQTQVDLNGFTQLLSFNFDYPSTPGINDPHLSAFLVPDFGGLEVFYAPPFTGALNQAFALFSIDNGLTMSFFYGDTAIPDREIVDEGFGTVTLGEVTTISAVPEPSSLALLGSGLLAGVGWFGRRVS
jgi:hypothetical protein